MGISVQNRKILWGRSGNRCAFPGCSQTLHEKNEMGDNYIIGEECHIEAQSKGGPRYNNSLSESEIDSYDNLILLCPTHHTMIDNDPEKFTVAVLRKMKAEHEEKISNNTKTVFDNAETDIINRMDLVKWINGLEKNMMDISLFLDETLGEKNPEIRRLKYRDFSKKLSDLCTDFYIEVETYSRIAKKEFGVDGIERELRVVISYFSDEIRKRGDYYLHEANTNDALDGNNNICNIMHRKISLIRNKII